MKKCKCGVGVNAPPTPILKRGLKNRNQKDDRQQFILAKASVPLQQITAISADFYRNARQCAGFPYRTHADVPIGRNTVGRICRNSACYGDVYRAVPAD